MSLKQPAEHPKDAKARNWKKYKFIVMNQTNDNEQEVKGGSAESTVMSPTLSPCRAAKAGQHSEVQGDDEVSEHRDEMSMSQSVDSCSNIR